MIPNSLFMLCLVIIAVDGSHHISNFNKSCFDCLCFIHGCDWHRGCSGGYCGPFYMPKIYWADAGKPTKPGDSPDTDKGYENCVQNEDCAFQTMLQYLSKYGKDCNNDGVTDCFDYMMINHNGGPNCTPPLSGTTDGAHLVPLFYKCRL